MALPLLLGHTGYVQRTSVIERVAVQCKVTGRLKHTHARALERDTRKRSL